MDYTYKKGLLYVFGKIVRTMPIAELGEIVKPAVADFRNRKCCCPRVLVINAQDLKDMTDYFNVDVASMIEPRTGLRLATAQAPIVPAGKFALDVL